MIDEDSMDSVDKNSNLTDSAKEKPICLDQFLKLSAIVGTGGEAKYLIQSGVVSVNGEVETRRRRKLQIGDVIDLDEISLTVEELDD